MKFITSSDNGYDLRSYLAHLDSIRSKLPPNAREFAFAPGHYDFSHRRCPHDSWLDSVSITEVPEGDRKQIRNMQVHARFLSAYHDGFFELTYAGVASYQFVVPSAMRGKAAIGHGDWVVDEILIDGGLISHEIIFSHSGRWTLLCKDIKYLWSTTQ